MKSHSDPAYQADPPPPKRVFIPFFVIKNALTTDLSLYYQKMINHAFRESELDNPIPIKKVVERFNTYIANPETNLMNKLEVGNKTLIQVGESEEEVKEILYQHSWYKRPYSDAMCLEVELLPANLQRLSARDFFGIHSVDSDKKYWAIKDNPRFSAQNIFSIRRIYFHLQIRPIFFIPNAQGDFEDNVFNFFKYAQEIGFWDKYKNKEGLELQLWGKRGNPSALLSHLKVCVQGGKIQDDQKFKLWYKSKHSRPIDVKRTGLLHKILDATSFAELTDYIASLADPTMQEAALPSIASKLE